MPICPHCGDEQEIDLHEVWSSREFMVSTCCEQSEEEVRWGLAHDPEWARALLQHLGIETICGERLRRVADDGLGALILDWQLRLDRIAFRDARRFIDRHHEHLPGPTGWRYGQGIWNGPDLLGVVTVGQPLARALDPQQVVEVTRLCVRRDRPEALRWNACSQLYGWAAREAQLRGFRRIITYTRQDECAVVALKGRVERRKLSTGTSGTSRDHPAHRRGKPRKGPEHAGEAVGGVKLCSSWTARSRHPG